MREQKTVKRILSLVLTFALFLSLLNSVSYTVFATESTSNEGFTYEVLNGTYCTITGYTGTAAEVVIPSEIDGYIVQQISNGAFRNNKNIEKVVFSENIEKIGSYIFYGCTSLTYVGFNNKLTNIGEGMFGECTALTEITIPVGVTEIGQSAFISCAALKEVNLPETLTTICSYAFNKCTELTDIVIPDNVKEIDGYAFNDCTNLVSVNLPAGWETTGTDSSYRYNSPFTGCTKLTEITLPEGMKRVPAYAFESMTSLKTINFPEGLTEVGNDSLSGCTELTGVVFPDSLTVINTNAFSGCRGMKEVVFSSSLQTIGGYAFGGCSGLTEVIFPDSVTVIDRSAFSGCTGLKEAKFSNSLEIIGESAFYGCTGLLKVTLPETITTINESVFSGCTALKEVNLPETLTAISSYAFNNCTGLTSIDIPDSVKVMDGYAFKDCTNLVSVNLPLGWEMIGGNSSYRYYSPFDGCEKLTEITFPEGMIRIPDYAFAYCTFLKKVIMPDSVTEIGRSAFNGCSGLEKAEFSSSLEIIGDYAFSGCTGLTEVIFPETLTTINSSAFRGCTGLTEVTFPEALTAIDSSAFSGCTGLKKVTIPETITAINESVFSGCTALKEVNLPETLTTICSYAFNKCTELTDIVIPDNVKEIDGYAFNDCTNLVSVNLPAGWETTGTDSSYRYNSPFTGCTKLTEITLPEGMKRVPAYAFESMTSLKTINFPEGLTEVGNDSFSGCTGLITLNLPESVRVINSRAFYNCTGFRMLNLNENLEFIGAYAFAGCDGLVSLVLNENLTTLSDYAFSNCANLTATRVPKSVTSFGRDSFINCSKITIYCYSGSAAHMALENTSYTYYLLDEHEHEYEVIIETAATCTRGGSQIKTCTICGYNCIELVEALGHMYSSDDTRPTCTEKGYTTYICSRCGDTYIDDYVDALGHVYGEWQIRTNSTCTENGEKFRVCQVCGYEEIAKIPADGHSYETDVIQPDCTEKGYTEYICKVCGYSYKSDYIDAKGHSFGEWLVDKEATVLAEGSQHRDCKVCSYTETKIIDRIAIDIDTNKDYGQADFTVVNAQTLEPISGAQIYISTEKDGENTFTTDSNGQVSIILPIGKQTISAYASDCLTRNLNVNINTGVNKIKQIGLSSRPTYNADINSTLMTIEEIEKAGIDTSDPSNKHVYKYELTLEFEPEIDTSSIIAYFNEEGTFLGGYSPDNAPAGGDNGENGDGETDQTYSLHYHVTTDGYWHSWCKNIEVDKGQNISLTYYPTRNNEDYVFDGWYEDETFTKKIYSVNIENYTTYVYGRWIYIGEEETETKPVTATGGIRIPVKDDIVTVYPVSEYFYLVIRGEVKWLKEMFDVEMLVINNSNTDTLENLTATLELPKGLSLAKMVDKQQTLSQEIGYIGEGDSTSVHWYVRGDNAGSYSLKARLEGMVMPFEEPINDVFVAENQLQVWAGNALNLHFQFPNAAYHGEDYPITITLSNVSDITLYNVSHMVQIEQGMNVYYSDGTKKEKIERSSWKYIGVRELHPGDKIIVEASVNIFYESEIIQMELEKLIGVVDGIEQLENAYKTVKAVADATDMLMGCVSGCSKALDDFNYSSGGDEDKIKLFKQLHSKVTGLMSAYTTSGNKTIDAAVSFANSGVNASLNAITSNPDEWLKNHAASDIKTLLKQIEALENSITSSAETSKKFDIYDSIRTAISAIPIRFALKNVIMTEDENNTTCIPWSYSVTDSSVRYFGVSNVSKYLMSITQAALGKVYDENMPWYLQLIPGLDDPFNTDAAIKYIQATENEIAQFKAKDATGNVTFKAWVERNKTSAYSLKRSTVENDFDLSCDNETARYENGVLIFNGDGMISVTPRSMTGGTLYIEDSEGNVYTYVIDVVEEHSCTAGEQEVIIAPTVDYDGFAVKCCPTCGDIMEIIPLYYKNICEEHTFSEWITNTDATCTEAGVQIRTCTSCGTVEYGFIKMTDHICENWEVVTEATCYAEGEEKAICTVCKNEVTRTIKKKSHIEGNWIVTKKASAFEEGKKELYCLICKKVIKTELIPMTKETFGYSEGNEEKLIVGLPECVTPDMLIAHYNNMGISTNVTAADGQTVEYVGTGCKVYFGDVEYTVVLKGDTTGDGIIDIFDMLDMLDYINGEGQLDGVYKQAGLVVNEEEIDIFDILAVLDHVNGDTVINP